MTRPFLITAFVLAVSSAVVSGQKAPAAAADNYDAVVAKYLYSARQQVPADPNHWINGLMGDRRAGAVNDLVTVRVMESISASGTADSNLSKKGNAGAAVANLFGV